MPRRLCDPCQAVLDSPISLSPSWVVHPEHGKPQVFDVRCQAKCPTCAAIWHRGTDNVVRLVA